MVRAGAAPVRAVRERAVAAHGRRARGVRLRLRRPWLPGFRLRFHGRWRVAQHGAGFARRGVCARRRGGIRKAWG